MHGPLLAETFMNTTPFENISNKDKKLTRHRVCFASTAAAYLTPLSEGFGFSSGSAVISE
jgi:hypothetical protein